MRTRRVLVVGAVVAALSAGGAASAYWVVGSTGTGSVTGTVATPNSQHITVVASSNLTGLYPGKAVVLAGTFTNPTMPVTVRTVTVRVATVDKPGCRVEDFTLSKTATAVNAVIPVGREVGHWGGDLSLTMRNDPKRDQSACQGAHVTLALTSN